MKLISTEHFLRGLIARVEMELEDTDRKKEDLRIEKRSLEDQLNELLKGKK